VYLACTGDKRNGCKNLAEKAEGDMLLYTQTRKWEDSIKMYLEIAYDDID
jgi:hypothetical protein